MPRGRPILTVRVVLSALFLTAVADAFGQLPPGFRRSPFAVGLFEPTAMTFAPDGRLFIAERGGRIVSATAKSAFTLMQVPEVSLLSGESGVLGLACHPDFDDNGWLYVFYTPQLDGVLNCRIARFTIADGIGDPLSEVVIWQTEVDVPPNGGHLSGCLQFGPEDGMLYATVGDTWKSQLSQDITAVQGKLVRMTPDGAPAPDNPFADEGGLAPFVWAYGLRNPYRFHFDPKTAALYVGDVGENISEEVDRIERGDNCGWPYMEGSHCFVSDCDAFAAPLWSYKHGDPQYGGQSVIMGPPYRGRAFPPGYDGSVFVADFSGSYIRRLVLGSSGAVLADPEFCGDCWWPVDVRVGPDGAIYYLTFWPDPELAGVYRIDFIGGENEPPIAQALAAPTQGSSPPLLVQFSSAGSYDPDGAPQALSYRWTFGDGAESTLANPRHSFAQRGAYIARLYLSDGQLETVSDPIMITVGDKPSVDVILPAEGFVFRAGDEVAVAAGGFDVEDGILAPEAFSWSVYIIRPDNALNLLHGPIASKSGSFVVPTSGRPLEDSLLRLEVTVTDSDGLSAKASRDLLPVVSPLQIDSRPSGIPVFLNERPIATPHINLGPEGYEYTLTAQLSYELDGVTYDFVAWEGYSDGATLQFVAPEGGATYVADYVKRGPVQSDDQGAAPDEEPDPTDSDTPPPCLLAPLLGAGALALLPRRRAGRSKAA